MEPRLPPVRPFGGGGGGGGGLGDRQALAIELWRVLRLVQEERRRLVVISDGDDNDNDNVNDNVNVGAGGSARADALAIALAHHLQLRRSEKRSRDGVVFVEAPTMAEDSSAADIDAACEELAERVLGALEPALRRCCAAHASMMAAPMPRLLRSSSSVSSSSHGSQRRTEENVIEEVLAMPCPLQALTRALLCAPSLDAVLVVGGLRASLASSAAFARLLTQVLAPCAGLQLVFASSAALPALYSTQHNNRVGDAVPSSMRPCNFRIAASTGTAPPRAADA